ncbi:MAG: hypothetical protein WC856_02430 [Methylococcaceae bacterium]|jgi:hypothetical protein
MTTTVSDLVAKFAAERPIGGMLDDTVVLAQALAAVSYYSGWADLDTHLAIPIAVPAPSPPTPYPAITANTVVSVSEWALIKPLFLLYVERENSLYLEASRGKGVDVFGRASSEVSGDITQMELGFPHMAAYSPIVTI